MLNKLTNQEKLLNRKNQKEFKQKRL